MFLDTVGKRVQLLRRERDLKQTELSELLQSRYGLTIGQSYVSQLERSARMPNSETVAALARALGTTTDFLLMLTDDPAPRGTGYPGMTPEAQAVSALMEALPAEKRGEVLQIVRVIAAYAP